MMLDAINNTYFAESFFHNVSMDWRKSRRWFKYFCAYGNNWHPADMYHKKVMRGNRISLKRSLTIHCVRRWVVQLGSSQVI